MSATKCVVMGSWYPFHNYSGWPGVETRGLDSLDVSFFSYFLTIFYFWNYIFRSIFVSRSYPKLWLRVGIARRNKACRNKACTPYLVTGALITSELKFMADYRTPGLSNPRIIDT